MNSKGAPKDPISTATVWGFLTSNSSSRFPSDVETHRRVILRREFDGRVLDKFATASVDPDADKAATVFLAADVSPLAQAVLPTLRARKVRSPR